MRKLLILALLCPILSMCQPLALKGKVLNEQGEPIAGATIILKRYAVNAEDPNPEPRTMQTDKGGEFTFTYLRLNDTLFISAIGYEPQRLIFDQPLAQHPEITLVLSKKTSSLDDVVVIAYGTTSRRLNTGSVSQLKAADISRQPVSNPLSTLEGRIPGLTVVQTSGLPGAAVQLQIRGQSSLAQGSDPFFIIDGVPFAAGNGPVNQLTSALTTGRGAGLSPFSTLNPADIESIEVLKDADATAIYGSRGANGVILITTKKGRAGALRTTASLSTAWSRATRTPEMLNTQQYLQMRREALANDGLTANTSNAPDMLLWDTTRYTDFRKLLLGGTARSTQARLSFAGGSNKTTFQFSGGYSRETTVFPGPLHDTRGSLSLSLAHGLPSDRLQLSLSASYGVDANNLTTGNLATFINLPPNTPPLYKPDGSLNWEEGGFAFTNPMAFTLRRYRAGTGNLVSRVLLSYRLLEGLNLRTSVGYNTLSVNEMSLTPIAAQDPQPGPKGESRWGKSNRWSWIAEPQLTFQQALGGGLLDILVGTTWQQNTSDGLTVTGTGYANDALLQSLAAAPTLGFWSNSSSQYRYGAVFGRINYNYRGTYVVNLSGRRDGSSRFGPGRQFASFGAVGAAWIFSNERWMQKALPALSFGKLRASFGTTGNDQIGDYRYLDAWASSFPYGGQATLYPAALFNPDYGWEVNKKWEGALELGFLQNRLFLSLAWYRNRSSNQLVDYVLPTQTGFYSIINNFPALMQNRGWELELTTTNLQTPAIRWTTHLNLSLPRNTLLAFPGIESSAYAATYRIGHPLSVINALVYTGVDKGTGLFSFEDVNKDGSVTTPADYAPAGYRAPRYYGGLGNTVQYKGWELHMHLAFKKQTGTSPLHNLYNAGFLPGRIYNQPELVLDRWQGPGNEAVVQRFTTNSGGVAYSAAQKFIASSGSYTDASFIRLRNLSLAYSLPRSILSGAKLQEARFFVQGQNLFTITRYPGSDPETQNLFTMPPLRTLSVGIQITL